jgi:hypothetical protein
MRYAKTVRLYMIVAAFLFCLTIVSATRAQATKEPEDNRTLQSLLNEVRLLRKSFQQASLNAYRSQIVIERLRASNDQIERLTNILEDVRSEREKLEQSIPRMDEERKLIESDLTQETDVAKRAQLEFRYKEQKRISTNYKQRVEELKEQEQQVSTQLRAEQVRAGEFDSRLDTLEREIENEIDRQRAEDKAPENTKRP